MLAPWLLKGQVVAQSECIIGMREGDAYTPSRGEMPSLCGAIRRAGHLPLYIDRSSVEGHALWEMVNRTTILV